MFLTRDQIKESIMYKLGYPMIDVQLKLGPDGDSIRNHLDDVINQTLDFFFRHNTEESTYLTWLTIPAIEGQSIYPIPYWVEEITDVYASFSSMLASPFMLFDSNSMESFVSLSVNFSDWDFISYTTSRMYLEEIGKAVGASYYAKLIINANVDKEVHVFPPPRGNGGTGSKALIAKVYRRAELGKLYGHPYFIEICAARLMEIWGRVLNVFNATLPGGGTINGQWLHDQGVANREKYEQKVIEERPSAMILIG
jgi:hypothetical protein